MQIDPTVAVQALAGIKTVVDILRGAKDLLPASSKKEKEEIENALSKAERELKLAEGQLASGLEYELCRNHFPPEIMLSKDDLVWTCSVCGNAKDTGPQISWISF